MFVIPKMNTRTFNSVLLFRQREMYNNKLFRLPPGLSVKHFVTGSEHAYLHN